MRRGGGGGVIRIGGRDSGPFRVFWCTEGVLCEGCAGARWTDCRSRLRCNDRADVASDSVVVVFDSSILMSSCLPGRSSSSLAWPGRPAFYRLAFNPSNPSANPLTSYSSGHLSTVLLILSSCSVCSSVIVS